MKLSAFLIKEECNDFEDVLKSQNEILPYDLYDLSDYYEFESAIILAKPKTKQPEWIRFIESEIEDNLIEHYNRSISAIILVRINDYLIAFTFGRGRFMIRDKAIIKDFGIKVTLNLVDSDKIKGIDKTTIDENLIKSRQQSNKELEVHNYDLNSFKDFVRALSGETTNSSFSSSITGNESFQFNQDIEYYELYDIAELLLQSYMKDDYISKFPWYDKMVIEKDKEIIEFLYEELCLKLIKSPNSVDLLIPDFIDFNIDEMSFTEKGYLYDFNIDSLLNYFRTNSICIEPDSLKRKSIYVHDSNELYKWKLLDCLTTEVDYKENHYMLYSGMWFKISASYQEEIEAFLSNIVIDDISFPTCKHTDTEGQYNKRVARKNHEYLLMDIKTVEGIEVCDLFSANKVFVHVKPWKSSSTLSHLFSQGRVAAEKLLNDYEFREKVINKIKALEPTFPNIELYNFNPRNYQVTYAIIYSESCSPIERIPFFSKVNLKHSLELINHMGYKTSVCKIERLSENDNSNLHFNHN